MLIAFASLMANAEKVKIGELYYNLDDANKTAEVTFSDNSSYLSEIVIPSTVEYNGYTYSVTSIGYAAFESCSDLTSVSIPKTVTSIGDQAFGSCTNLEAVYCSAETPPSIYSTTFSTTTYRTAKLCVPKGCVHDYKAEAYWSKFNNIIEGEFGGIADVIADGAAAEIVGYYNLQGVRSAEPWGGMNIVVYSDGSHRKVMY